MESFDEKLSKIVWKKPAPKKRQKSPKLKLFAGIFLVFAALAAGLFFSPVFQIKKIGIEGNAETSGQKMEAFARSYFNFFGGSEGNLLFLKVNDLSEKMKSEFSELEEIAMKKDFLNRALMIKVIEKKPIGIWCSDDSPCFYLERKGTIFKEAPATEGSLILLIRAARSSLPPELGEKVIDEKPLDFILYLRKNLPPAVNLSVREFTFKPQSRDVEALTGEGFKIYFDSQKDAGAQLANLKILLDEKIKEERSGLEYVDMREGNRIYYKLKNAE
ncbi:MAG: hypothetical protein Q8L57_03560 [bacterium]|nr:hypothetical protein [bacterium]